MDLQSFIDLKPSWGMDPALYIIRHDVQGNTAYRCGRSGTSLFNQTDQVYGSDRATYTGLLGRCSMYKGFWTNAATPHGGKIYAALRIRRQLVADPEVDRVAEDSAGNTYNVNRGNRTLVMQREKEYHDALDKKGYRWQKDRSNELFVPGPRGVLDLISVLKTIRGEDFYLFEKDEIIQDTTYKPPKALRGAAAVIETAQRRQPERAAADDIRAPTIKLKLTKRDIEDLRAGGEAGRQKYELLVRIVRAVANLQDIQPTANTPQPPPPPPPPPEPNPTPAPAPRVRPPPTPRVQPPPPPPTPLEPPGTTRVTRSMAAASRAEVALRTKRGRAIARALAQLATDD